MINTGIKIENKHYSLGSTFWGVFIILQTIIYLCFISLDTIFLNKLYIYGTDIFTYIFSLFAAYLTWVSATYHAEENPTSLWGGIAKGFIVLIIFINTIFVFTGTASKNRIMEVRIYIQAQKLVKQIESTTNELYKMNNQMMQMLKNK